MENITQVKRWPKIVVQALVLMHIEGNTSTEMRGTITQCYKEKEYNDGHRFRWYVQLLDSVIYTY